MTQERPPPSHPPAGTVAHGLAERLEAVIDEVMADMAAAISRALARPPDSLACHGFLRPVAASGQLLDSLSVAVARVEVHARVHARRILAQDSLGLADPFEERVPVGGLEDAQAPDGGGDALVGRRIPGGPLHRERDGDGVRQGLEQDDAEKHGQRPALRHRERAHGLELPDEARDRLHLDVVRAGRHDLPSQRVGHGESAKVTGGTEREPALECGRKLLVHQLEGPLDDVIVVEQPLRGRAVRARGASGEPPIRGIERLLRACAGDRQGEGRRLRSPLLRWPPGVASAPERRRRSPQGRMGWLGLSAPDGSAPPPRLASARARLRDPGTR